MTAETAQFWNWFKENNKAYVLLDEDDKAYDDLLNELQSQLHEYCDQLYFEIGGMPGEVQELVITAEGKTDFFEQVELLINSAPAIDNWIFTAFIQPKEGQNGINFEDVELTLADMWFLPLQNASNPKGLGLKVCVPNYELLSKSKWFSSAVYKLLDSLLGEKSFALDIDHVAYGNVPDKPEEQGMSELVDLPRYVKWKKTKLNAS